LSLIQNKHLDKSLDGRNSGPQRSPEKTGSEDDARMLCICKLHTTAIKMCTSALLFNYGSCLNKNPVEKSMPSQTL